MNYITTDTGTTSNWNTFYIDGSHMPVITSTGAHSASTSMSYITRDEDWPETWTIHADLTDAIIKQIHQMGYDVEQDDKYDPEDTEPEKDLPTADELERFVMSEGW